MSAPGSYTTRADPVCDRAGSVGHAALSYFTSCIVNGALDGNPAVRDLTVT